MRKPDVILSLNIIFPRYLVCKISILYINLLVEFSYCVMK